MNPVIPAPVPVPLPAPFWLLEFLLVFTFILHLIPMNLLLGGGILVAISSRLGRADSHHRELAHRCSHVMPAVTAFTITLGVAPLLFLQVIYGQLFYTSSVLMAWSWLGVIFLLMLGYYGIYWFNLQHEELGTRAFWVMLVSAVLFIHISLIFTQNMTFMLRPQEFYDTFLRHRTGAYLGLFDAMTIARWLHFIVAGVATSGLAIALGARYWRKEGGRAADWAAWAESYGTRWFLAATGAELFVGVAFLMTLPPNTRSLFFGGSTTATVLLGASILFAILALGLASFTPRFAALAILVTISLMAILRHIVRVATLAPHFDPRTLPVSPQWPIFVFFAILLVAGLAVVVWMLIKFFRPTSSAASAD